MVWVGAWGQGRGAGADGAGVLPLWLQLCVMSWGVNVHLSWIYCFPSFVGFVVLGFFFCKTNSRQTLSGEFNNMMATKQIPGTNHLKFCTV